jgi:hypothetical protein
MVKNARNPTTKMSDEKSAKPPRKRLRKAGIWSGALLVAAVCACAVAVFSLLGTRVTAPDWVKTRVEDKINSDVAGMSLSFGDLSMVLQADWVPRLVMQNVVIEDGVGTPLVQLSDVQGTVSLGAMLRGEMRPGSIGVTGVRLLVRRDADGAINMQLGNAGGEMQEAQSLADMIDKVDEVLQRPHFASLRSFSANNLALRYEDARAGQAWNVDGGQIRISREDDTLSIASDLTLLGDRGFATTLRMGYHSQIGSTAASFSMAFSDMPSRDIAGQSPALSWLEALDAPISGALAVELDAEGNLGPLAANLDIGQGFLHPNDAARPIAFEHAGADLTYDPDTALIRFAELQVVSKWINTRVAGQTHLEGMEDGWPDTLISQFRAFEFEANPLELYPSPISLDGATLDMRLQLDPFEVTLGEMTITDQGRHMRVEADISARTDGWLVAAAAHIPEIAPDRLLELWPQSLEPKTRNWITTNVKTAQLSNIQFALRSVPGEKPDVHLGFDFDDLETRFIRDVPHIEEGRGTASIFDNQFVISAHGGFVNAAQGGRIDITGSSFDIPDISIPRGPGVVRLKTDSTITAALSLLNEEPFGFIDKAGQSVTVADGRARMVGRLDFNVIDNLKPDDVKFTLNGELSDVRSETLVNGRVLAASKLEVDANSDRLKLGGKGRVGQVPFDGYWTMPLTPGSNGRAQVTGSIELSERFMDEFQIGLPPGSVSGAGRGDIEMDFERGSPPAFRLTSDLSGLALSLRQVDWSVGAQETGELSVSGTLGQPPSIDTLSLTGGGLRAQGSVTLQPDGQLQQANFSRVQLDNWIDAPLDLVGLGPGQPPLIRVIGGSVDLRQTSLAGQGRSGQSGNAGGPISLRLDRLTISDGISLTEFNAELDMSQGADGEFTGRVNGQTPVKGRVIPQNGRSAFIVTSQDAGGVFRSANLLNQARDGRLELVLAPGDGQGVYEGKLDARNMRIKDAPAMAALLNAISVVGILEQMSGEGIHFAEVQGKFQLAPDRVTLYSGSAVGASMGISMEGYYYPENKWLDMEGVISPVYAINALGRVFARKGEGLVGFTYDVDGVASNPRVQVNPLSVLTPGLFRELFRGPPPTQPGQWDAVQENDPEPDNATSDVNRDR